MLSLVRVTLRRISLRRVTHQQLQGRSVVDHVGIYHQPWVEASRRLLMSHATKHQETAEVLVADASLSASPATESDPARTTPQSLKDLPLSCPGCGAFSQTLDPEAAGFFRLKRSSNRQHTKPNQCVEDQVFKEAIGRLTGNTSTHPVAESTTTAVPICDRCHQLLHHSTGKSIIHPGVESIRAIIEESPHKHNHIYHVVDAADFPMSLIPNLQHALRLPRLRTQNRRSKTINYVRGRVAEVSFIITRSDLLAPKKEQVDRLMPYLQDVLRDALGRQEKNIRLGNVRCVSAKRGWWTPVVKEDIWKRGGAGWMVGKVNVGKSALFEVVYPKGRVEEEKKISPLTEGDSNLTHDVLKMSNEASSDESPNIHEPASLSGREQSADSETEAATQPLSQVRNSISYQETELSSVENQEQEHNDESSFEEEHIESLLPPLQPETAYPSMPLVSSLPGTTASPIRVPFGSGRGELIDLPGIHRSSLEQHVMPENRADLVMKNRITPEQYSIKPGQSLLLGGMIRITPRTEGLVLLAYPFVPLKPHVTNTDKAVGIQTGSHPNGEPYEGQVTGIATETAKSKMESAGTFMLEWNVTKKRAGPVTDPAAGKQKANSLPFIVYGADILVEGVGWVEITCQVRARSRTVVNERVIDALGEGIVQREGPTIPEVEVFSPEGRYVGIRRPMNAWLLGGPQKEKKGRHGGKSRPRMSASFRKRTQHGS